MENKEFLSEANQNLITGIDPKVISIELMENLKLREKQNEVIRREMLEGLKLWEGKNESEFKKSLKSIKHILKKRGLILPKNWSQVFFGWYLGTLPEQDSIHINELHKMISDETILIQWAEQYTDSKIITSIEVEAKTEKNHSQKTRIDLEAKYRFYLMDKLGMIDPKGIFYDTNLSLNERAKLLSKILGYNERECKDLLNGKTHFNEEKKSDLDDFLNDLINKRKK